MFKYDSDMAHVFISSSGLLLFFIGKNRHGIGKKR